MRDPRIKKYIKKMEYSYAMGTYPTLDMLKFRKDKVLKVLLSSKGGESKGISEIIDICKRDNIKYEVSDSLISHIAVKDNTYAVGIFDKYQDELSKTENHVVLEHPRNMGNIGTIIRTMVGFGYRDLAIIKPAADIFDPMIVRSAMGALFQMRFRYFDTYEEYLKEFGNHKQYLLMLDGAKPIEEIIFESPFSIVMGNESEGLPSEYTKYGQSVFIPHSNDIDSLNLSVATGITLYLSKKR